jgi:hypothetical protein
MWPCHLGASTGPAVVPVAPVHISFLHLAIFCRSYSDADAHVHIYIHASALTYTPYTQAYWPLESNPSNYSVLVIPVTRLLPWILDQGQYWVTWVYGAVWWGIGGGFRMISREWHWLFCLTVNGPPLDHYADFCLSQDDRKLVFGTFPIIFRSYT